MVFFVKQRTLKSIVKKLCQFIGNIFKIKKSKPKRNPIIKQNFIKVIFMFVNILPGFHRDFCVCENNEYITEKHYIFLLGV